MQQKVREAIGSAGKLAEGDCFIGSVFMSYTHRDGCPVVPVDAFVPYIELLPVAIEQRPERLFRVVPLRVGVEGIVGQPGHEMRVGRENAARR